MINEQHVLTSSNGQDTGEWLEIGIKNRNKWNGLRDRKNAHLQCILVTRIKMDFSKHGDIPSYPISSIFEEAAPAPAVSDSNGNRIKMTPSIFKIRIPNTFSVHIYTLDWH